MPLNFIHLSDIHFGHGEGSEQFDRDGPLRKALVRDLGRNPATVEGYNAVLVTGDVAFGGSPQEYVRAQQWLDELCTQVRCGLEDVYLICGNHDIDRKVSAKWTALWNNHLRLRTCHSTEIHDQLKVQLLDKSCNPLAPLEAFNNFAVRYECHTTREQLAWKHELQDSLSDGSRVLLHGLNSALISDEDDEPGKLLVSDFQLGEIEVDTRYIHVVLCHHPPPWLLDRISFENKVYKCAHIQLYGHEHDARPRRVENSVQLFAGAFHPPRSEANWQPCYHILQIEIQTDEKSRQLRVRVFTRNWRPQENEFVAVADPDGKSFVEYVLPLPRIAPTATLPDEKQLSTISASAVSSVSSMAAETPNRSQSKEIPDARRLLIVHFLGLGTPLRYSIASKLALFREGDDTTKGYELWSRILQRAESEKRLRELWDAVAQNDKTLTGGNPFSD